MHRIGAAAATLAGITGYEATVAADLERVTGDDVWGFATEVSRYVTSTSSSLRGVQSGIAAFSVLISPNVTRDAIEASSGKAPVGR